jgi:hypothetical protein
MQEELVKHSRKILRIFRKTDATFIKKSAETGIEILIIVFSVSLSIWLHGLKEHHKEQKEVRIFLANIREDLKQDIQWLMSDTAEYKREEMQLDDIAKLASLKAVDLKKEDIEVSFPMYLFMNKINNGNYEGFKSSGKIGFIENEDLKKEILNYYQQDALKIVEMNSLFNQYQIETFDSFDNTLDDYTIIQKIQTRIEFLQLLAETNYRFCSNTLIKKANDLISAIDEELGN